MKIWKMKSVKTKLVIALISLLALTILGCWIMNQLFLPGYYQYSKVSALSDTFRKMSYIVEKDDNFENEAGQNELTEKSQVDMEALAANRSMNAYLFQINNFFGTLVYQFYYPSANSLSSIQRKNVEEKTTDYVLSMASNRNKMRGRVLLKQGKKYQVYKTYDERLGTYYLELFGQTETGYFVYISTNYQSMRENVKISNRFLTYMGLLSILLGIVLLLFITESFTKPIQKMTEIAMRMSQLDFQAKYPVTTEDEIGTLGQSINTLSEQLEQTISELKTANNELQKDIEKKVQIDEMRKDFLSNVSHELKTPIALIQGYAEGLQDNINEDSESREFYCGVIIDEANKMNKMVKKLLSLNQIEFGNNQVSFEHFDIVQVIESVMNSSRILAEQKGAVITMEPSQSLYVWADEYMVEEVITNYISNAINHVSGENLIKIDMEKKEEVVRITVFNTGDRIPESELDNIWIKFYKVDKARTRAYGGSGIGLSIVKAIMESMNQKCGVSNTEDGVEFWFELDCH